ncbi:MAG: hypothetical protein U0800_05900 [Isosphaeraceae bacterium]
MKIDLSRRQLLTGSLAAGLLATTKPVLADDPPAAKPADVESIDAILKALYEVISGPKGQARDWDRFRSLFAPDARLIPCRAAVGDEKPLASIRPMSPDDYVRLATPAFEKLGFFETEISRKLERFGHIAHAFSTYESREEPDAKPFARGINSIQLFYDDKRWWVVTIYWDAETRQQPIPAEYLPKGS